MKNRISLPYSCLNILLILVATFTILSSSAFSEPHKSSTIRQRYEDWQKRHGRRYANRDEWNLRFGIYQINIQFIEFINSLNLSYKLTDNQFADLTNLEFRTKYLGYKSHPDYHKTHRNSFHDHHHHPHKNHRNSSHDHHHEHHHHKNHKNPSHDHHHINLRNISHHHHHKNHKNVSHRHDHKHNDDHHKNHRNVSHHHDHEHHDQHHKNHRTSSHHHSHEHHDQHHTSHKNSSHHHSHKHHKNHRNSSHHHEHHEHHDHRNSSHHHRHGHHHHNPTVGKSKLPNSVDWRKNGAVSPIQDQGICGSCWAFSVIAAIEGLNKIKTGKLVSLSVQEIVDCDINQDNQGCNGGYMDKAYEYIKENGAIATEKEYPYIGKDGVCKTSLKKKKDKVMIHGYKTIPHGNEKAIQRVVSKQPVSVAIDAAGYDFQLYSQGVFSGSCGKILNHGVTIVGYGVENDDKYWLVRNSWGSTWGEEGYIKMKRGSDDESGICGINMEASYPVK